MFGHFKNPSLGFLSLPDSLTGAHMLSKSACVWLLSSASSANVVQMADCVDMSRKTEQNLGGRYTLQASGAKKSEEILLVIDLRRVLSMPCNNTCMGHAQDSSSQEASTHLSASINHSNPHPPTLLFMVGGSSVQLPAYIFHNVNLSFHQIHCDKMMVATGILFGF